MLQINSTSKNFDGQSLVNEEPIVFLNGSITNDNFYVSLSSSDIDAIKTSKAAVLADIEEFLDAMLGA